ncbi:MAG: DEAD/DEAH box helicase, partial [Pseudoclavibacter sp.]
MSDSGRSGGRRIPVGPFDLARISRGLPAAGVLADLAAAFAAHRAPRLVIEAPPGSGKTTVVPPAIADRIPGRVVVAEPRRLAARAAAHRLAELTGTQVGGLAGYSVRGERRVSAGTRVEFVTSGLLLRRLLADPELPGVGAVVLDEAHERELDGDLAFALVDEVAQLRGDLAIAAMSATLDAERWAALLGADSRVLSVPMRPHPLQVVWDPAPPGAAPRAGGGGGRAGRAPPGGGPPRGGSGAPAG